MMFFLRQLQWVIQTFAAGVFDLLSHFSIENYWWTFALIGILLHFFVCLEQNNWTVWFNGRNNDKSVLCSESMTCDMWQHYNRAETQTACRWIWRTTSLQSTPGPADLRTSYPPKKIAARPLTLVAAWWTPESVSGGLRPFGMREVLGNDLWSSQMVRVLDEIRAWNTNCHFFERKNGEWVTLFPCLKLNFVWKNLPDQIISSSSKFQPFQINWFNNNKKRETNSNLRYLMPNRLPRRQSVTLTTIVPSPRWRSLIKNASKTNETTSIHSSATVRL